jgi:[ribosomal protein S5]-alanine N-acetyltransferase
MSTRRSRRSKTSSGSNSLALAFERLAEHHAARVFGELQAAELYAYIPEQPPSSVDALAARYARLAAGGPAGELWRNWIVLDSDQPVGTLQATVYADGRADVAWVIYPRYWRRGYGAASAAWMLAELAAHDGVTQFEATIDPRNTASLRLAAKLGFVPTGTRDGDVVVGKRL